MTNYLRPATSQISLFSLVQKSMVQLIDWDAIDSKSIKKLTSYHM
ncbi:unnamed protein product [Moneuplotes crassus]|uniref:Uncharacterized protein n=1 Tax=Euplotes crassus TaxID=5936 RepID=A0AAD1Y2M0_EUPCR|nr:unnamed protein product [Moneuplotes crassus]